MENFSLATVLRRELEKSLPASLTPEQITLLDQAEKLFGQAYQEGIRQLSPLVVMNGITMLAWDMRFSALRSWVTAKIRPRNSSGQSIKSLMLKVLRTLEQFIIILLIK